ncbi:12326_t:CDS:2, partial [Dentiscutata erythropus]
MAYRNSLATIKPDGTRICHAVILDPRTPENNPIENFTKLAIPFLEIDEREGIHQFVRCSILSQKLARNNTKRRKALELNFYELKQPQEIACSSNEEYPVHVLVSDVTRYHQLPASS